MCRVTPTVSREFCVLVRFVYALPLYPSTIMPLPRLIIDWFYVLILELQVAEYACGYLQHLAGHLGVRIGNVVRMPKNRKLFSVLRSPHVNKTSMEQFAKDTYKRLICVYDTAPETLDVFYREVERRPPVGVLVKITDRRGVSVPVPEK